MTDATATANATATEPHRPGPGSTAPGRRPGGVAPAAWWSALAVFLGVGAAVWVVVSLSGLHLPRTEWYPRPEAFEGGVLLEGWVRWDAYWYRAIARDGYVYHPGVQSSVAFFPAYPIVIAALHAVGLGFWTAGVVTTVLSGAVAVVAFRQWCLTWLDRRQALAAVAVLCCYPFAWYLYGAVYAEALFLAAAISAFLALERDRVWLAGLAGAVASGARPVGLVVAVALVLRTVERRARAADPAARGPARFDPRHMRRSDLPVLLSFVGFFAFAAYGWVSFGDPVAFNTVQSAPGWDQGGGVATWLKLPLVEELRSDPTAAHVLFKVAQGVLALGLLASAVWVARRFGWAYGLYVAGVVLLPLLGTKDFAGMGRYLLAAFPCAALAGAWLADRRAVMRVALVLSSLALAYLASNFARGHYVA